MKRCCAPCLALAVLVLLTSCSSPLPPDAKRNAARIPAVSRFELVPPKPANEFFATLDPKPAPQPERLLLSKGDRLAICGDSITEQKMYSRIMETYLTVCVPQLEVTARQYGWGGEKADGFRARMSNDCLRFQPTIATTCYGMNDHEYRPYQERIGRTYRFHQSNVVSTFLGQGVRVVLGSPGCVGRKPDWGRTNATTELLNQNLCTLRNIDIEIAREQETGFADVFWPMLVAGWQAQEKYGTNYAIAGGDGVHPGWAGHTVMAYAFLRALGLDGEIGTYRVDLQSGAASASIGHEVLAAQRGEVELRSSRYPFCATGNLKSDDSVRSAMTLVPFNRELNRLLLIATNGSAQSYKVTWGKESKTYSRAQLEQGVNLADDFVVNPFSAAFAKVDEAVGAKQAYETHQIKDVFHGPEFKAEPQYLLELTEKLRAPLAKAIQKAFVPVTHTIKIEAQ